MPRINLLLVLFVLLCCKLEGLSESRIDNSWLKSSKLARKHTKSYVNNYILKSTSEVNSLNFTDENQSHVKNSLLIEKNTDITQIVVDSTCNPTGSTFAQPIDVGVLTNCSYYLNTQENGVCFGNNYTNQQPNGQSSNDIFYKFTLTHPADVVLSHCNSPIDTYMHLLNERGELITSCDDNGDKCPGTQASISKFLNAGIYYVVSEGYGNISGVITTEIITKPVLIFDGENDKVEIVNNPNLNLGSGPMTVEAFVRTTRSSSGLLQAIVSKRNYTPYEGFIFGLWTDGHLWLQLGGSSNLGYNSGPIIFDDKFHHVAVTRNEAGIVNFYVDGVHTYSAVRTASASSAGPLRIGTDKFTVMPFSGIIKNVKIYNNALSEGQIQENLLSGKTTREYLLAYWPMNDSTRGQHIEDMSYNQNTGTLGVTTDREITDPTWACDMDAAETLLKKKFTENHKLNRYSSETINYLDTVKVYGIPIDIIVGPNPFQEETEVHIIPSHTNDSGYTLEVSSLDGKIHIVQKISSEEKVSLGKDLPSGVYVLTVSGNGVVKTSHKIIKIK